MSWIPKPSVSVVIKGDLVIVDISGTTSLLVRVCPGMGIPGGGGGEFTSWTWDLGYTVGKQAVRILPESLLVVSVYRFNMNNK